MKVTLKIWRQSDKNSKGQFVEYPMEDVDKDMSLFELMDTLNERLVLKGERPIVYDSDCREGICGQCGIMINGEAHGPLMNTSACHLHMRSFNDGERLTIEPFRSAAFPVRQDLSIDRSAMDRIIQAGGYVSVDTGQASDANQERISHHAYDEAMNAAACIGCGACIAACPNASAALFTGAKISHLHRLPQGQIESDDRVVNMVTTMDDEGFGNCSNHATCEAVCPAGISIKVIADMNKLYLKQIGKG